MPSHRSRVARGLLVARRQHVQMRTKLLNVVRGLAGQQRVELRPRALLTRGGWGELTVAPLSPALRDVVGAYEPTVTATATALAALDRHLAWWATRGSRVARLETMPGVGPISGHALVAAVDMIERFPSAKKLVAYAGLASSVRASGERVEYGRITKQGRSEIRAVWVQAAHAVLAREGPGGGAATALGRTHRPAAREEDGPRALARKLLTLHSTSCGTGRPRIRVGCRARRSRRRKEPEDWASCSAGVGYLQQRMSRHVIVLRLRDA